MTTPAEAGQVLAKLALNDPWFAKPDPAMAVAWAETFSVHQLELADMLAAVPLIFADEHRPRDRVLPIDVITKARAIRRDRYDRDPAARAAYEHRLDAKAAALEAHKHSPAVEGPKTANPEMARKIRQFTFGRPSQAKPAS